MSDPPLPPELFDHILDCLAPPHVAEDPRNGWPTFLQVPALAACTRVCRRWLPRARLHLYSMIYIHRNPKPLRGLVGTLTKHPTLASLVREVDILADHPDSVYHPLLHLLQLAPRLQGLHLHILNFDRNYPSSQITRLGHRTSVTTLKLRSVLLPSLAEFLRLIRSFVNLNDLTIFYLCLAKATSAATITELQAQRACWASPCLRRLDVSYVGTDAGGFLHLLGHDVEELRIAHSISYRPQADYADYIAGCENLKSLGLALSSTPETPPPENSYRALRQTTLDMLAAIRSSVLDLLHVSFVLHPYAESSIPDASALQPATGDPPRGEDGEEQPDAVYLTFRYQHTRTGALDALFDREFHDALVGLPAFPALSKLRFYVRDNSPVHGPAWWRKEIARRLPRLPSGKLVVDVERGEGSDDLWDPEPTPPLAP